MLILLIWAIGFFVSFVWVVVIDIDGATTVDSALDILSEDNAFGKTCALAITWFIWIWFLIIIYTAVRISIWRTRRKKNGHVS